MVRISHRAWSSVKHTDEHSVSSMQGLGFGGGSDINTAKAGDPSDRWGHDRHHDAGNVDSSRPKAFKESEIRHQSFDGAAEHRPDDKHTRNADRRTSAQKMEEERSMQDVDRWRDDHASDVRSHKRHSRDGDRHRDNRHDEYSQHRQSSDYHRHKRDRKEHRERGSSHEHHYREHRSRDQHLSSRQDRVQPREERTSHDCYHREDRNRDQHHSSMMGSQRNSAASRQAKDIKVDFDREIQGYGKMTPAARMKARTKLLLNKSSKQA